MLASLILSVALAANAPDVAVSVSGAPGDSTFGRALRIRLSAELELRRARVIELREPMIGSAQDGASCKQDLQRCLPGGAERSPSWAVFVTYDSGARQLRLELWQAPFSSVIRTVSRAAPDERQLLDAIPELVDDLVDPPSFPEGRWLGRTSATRLATGAFSLAAISLTLGVLAYANSVSVHEQMEADVLTPNLAPVRLYVLRQQGTAEQTGAAILIGTAGVCAVAGLFGLWAARPAELPRVAAVLSPRGGVVALSWELR